MDYEFDRDLLRVLVSRSRQDHLTDSQKPLLWSVSNDSLTRSFALLSYFLSHLLPKYVVRDILVIEVFEA